ncbi:hypothetical protein NC652_032861 [Populus alba x Populus x berolinensis]|nr:hypothetical protein NC652_032861 [Populus alba x Populus x berolinensis]
MGSIGKVLIASGEMLSYSVGAKDVSVLVLCPLELILVHQSIMSSYNVDLTCIKAKRHQAKDEKTWWNEKFRFDFPLADWKQLTHLKLRIMDQEFFTDWDLSVKPYDTYKGEIKIGLKFIANTEVLPERTFLAQVDEPRQPILQIHYKSLETLMVEVVDSS